MGKRRRNTKNRRTRTHEQDKTRGRFEKGLFGYIIRSGDILLIHMNNDPIRAGEIIQFKVEGFEFPIAHRVIKVHERRDSKEIYVLTKGDKNGPDDLQGGLYAPGQKWLERRHIMGRAFGILPCVGGWLLIVMGELPLIIQYIIIGAFALLFYYINLNV